MERFDVTYFPESEAVSVGKAPGMLPIRDELFTVLIRDAANVARLLHQLPDRVVGVGIHIEI